MSFERLVTPLQGGAVGVILVTLVAAAFTMPPASVGHATALAGASNDRAVPAARHQIREADAATVTVAAPDDPTDDVLVLPPPPFEPEPVAASEPAPAAAPVRAPANTALVTDDTRAAELQMLALMNASRAAAGLVALALDARVSNTARAHSDVESRYGYVYHDGPDGAASARDATACGTGWYGENTGKVWRGDVRALHVEFMSEPWEPINHRTNIMDPAFRRVGIGAVLGRDAMYMTMVFCR